jgi:hypothetical protein
MGGTKYSTFSTKVYHCVTTNTIVLSFYFTNAIVRGTHWSYPTKQAMQTYPS